MDIIKNITESQMRTDLPKLNIGDNEMANIELEEDSFDLEHFKIRTNLKSLEDLYNSEVINLEMYYQIKGNIIQKLVSISSEEVEAIKERL